MKPGYLLASASLLRIANAIPAYITTVFDCPDVVTITQTVYPPGWTATGPIYSGGGQPNAYPNAYPETYASTYKPSGPPTGECKETAPVTTSWETEYATTTVVYSEYGMYKGPPGCPSEIIAYMPTTVTCSEPRTTGWVGYTEDIACASCTATTLVGLEPSYAVNSGITATYVTIWTEVYIEQGASTYASVVGTTWIATGSIPAYLYPYNKACTGVGAYGGGGGGYVPPTQTYPSGGRTYTHSAGAYPSIDYNDPNNFGGGQSIPIQSAGYTSGAGQYVSPYTTPVVATEGPAQNGGPYSWTKGSYPSIDYSDPNYFKGGSGTGGPAATPQTYPPQYGPSSSAPSDPPTRPNTNTNGGGVKSYPDNFSDTRYFGPVSTPVGIVSATTQPPSIAPTATYTVPTSYTANYASIDANASENFKPLSTGITIVSLATAQTFAEPITTGSVNPATVKSVSYASLDFSDPSLFRGLDPNSAVSPTAAPTAAATTSATTSA